MLGLTSLICTLGLSVLNFVLDRPRWELAFGPVVAVLSALGWLGLGRKREPVLYTLMVFLFSLGLIAIYRIRPELLVRQCIWFATGLLLMMLVVRLRISFWVQRYMYVLGALALTLLALTVLFGQEIGGARAWLGLGPWRFQPVEIVKILMVLFLAAYLNLAAPGLQRGKIWYRMLLPDWQQWGPLLLMWSIAFILLVLQRDLGPILLLFSIFLFMLYLVSGNRFVVGTGIVLVSLGLISGYFLFPHVRVRLNTWLNPWADLAGRGYQIGQAMFALAAGGLTGTGLGQGFPYFIPEAHTDFIFAALGEELGLLGTGAILVSFLLIVARGFRLAAGLDQLSLLLVAGLTSIVALQTLIIIGGVIRLLPLTGITLPFMSYGGSALVSNMLIIALIMAFSQEGGWADGGKP